MPWHISKEPSIVFRYAPSMRGAFAIDVSLHVAKTPFSEAESFLYQGKLSKTQVHTNLNNLALGCHIFDVLFSMTSLMPCCRWIGVRVVSSFFASTRSSRGSSLQSRSPTEAQHSLSFSVSTGFISISAGFSVLATFSCTILPSSSSSQMKW